MTDKQWKGNTSLPDAFVEMISSLPLPTQIYPEVCLLLELRQDPFWRYHFSPSLGGDLVHAEMSEKTVRSLTPAFDSIPYRMQNRTGSTNSLLDDSDYFLNSGDLTGIPVVGSDNEDEETFASKDGLASSIRSEDSRGDGRRARDHMADTEKDMQMQNVIQKDLSSPFDKGPSVFKSIRKDFSIGRDDGKETFLAKEKTREGPFQDKRLEKMPKELDSRLKSSFLDKSGNRFGRQGEALRRILSSPCSCQ